MIPYEELDRALARWKARTHGGASPETAAPVIDDESQAPVLEAEAGVYESQPASGPSGLPRPSDQSGEINLEEEVIETYDEDQIGRAHV